jgi:hypothetical protein
MEDEGGGGNKSRMGRRKRGSRDEESKYGSNKRKKYCHYWMCALCGLYIALSQCRQGQEQGQE